MLPSSSSSTKMAAYYWILVAVCCFAGVCRGDIDVDADAPAPSRELNVTALDHFVDSDEGKAELEAEFETIKGGQRKPWTVGEANLEKNRHADLLAYDETRVHLPVEEGSDYINANYLDGFNREKEYIATQGPIQNTTNDIWAMVWDQNIKKMVMLANLVEHGESKVFKYWPAVNAMYGDITVVKVAEIPFPKFQHVLRIFLLKKGGVPRIVRHFHFVGWPDLGVPRDTNGIVSLLNQARYEYAPRDTAPILVHCSAGIGRTGTVILFDSMKEMAKGDWGRVDFPKRLDHMRQLRPDLVEKKEQYVFAHRAVRDALTSKETEAYLLKVAKAYKHAEKLVFEGAVLAASDAAFESSR